MGWDGFGVATMMGVGEEEFYPSLSHVLMVFFAWGCWEFDGCIASGIMWTARALDTPNMP